ncbi:hypothetical protein CC79DRAFT_1399903 [Sarocladium strictum]
MNSIPTTLIGSMAGELLLLLRSIVVASCLIYGCNWLHGYCQSHREEAAFAAQHGCQPVQATLPYKWPFAIDLLSIQYDALSSGRLLEFQSRFFDIAPTVRIDILGEGYIVNDPVNLETILFTRFEDFGLGARREGLLPLLGEGIFTQNGKHEQLNG